MAKYYVPLDDTEKHSLEYDVHRLISGRDSKFTNFVEVNILYLTHWLRLHLIGSTSFQEGRQNQSNSCSFFCYDSST